MKEIIEHLRSDPHCKERVSHVEVIPSRDAIKGTLSRPLPVFLKSYLEKRGITLYSHQCQAIEGIRAGKSIIITTPTASGKTMAFNLPIFEALQRVPDGTALYLYPTKALSNDQLKVILELETDVGFALNPAIYDGDTPTSRRPRIRERSRLVISNPYMLHQILPWHSKWKSFYTNLQFMVLDEAHQYRGVFGSNMAFLIRRFRRICQHYGSNPLFIISSATLANPLEFAKKLVGLEFLLISDDGSTRGTKHFVLYNPYFDGMGELSVHQESYKLFELLISKKCQTLCFTTSRKMAELLTVWTRKDLGKSSLSLASRITAYRAGYLPEERRQIEDKLKTGDLRGVFTTNALELGIDIGTLDAVIISGYPGTVISTWQQAGRAGRGLDESIAILVAFQNPLDQYFMNHPQIFFGNPHEHAIIDIMNPYIRAGHLLCAAAEIPYVVREGGEFFGDGCEGLIESFSQDGVLSESQRGWIYAGTSRPVDVVQLNSISSEIFKILWNGRVLETMDKLQAFREAHKGAVLLHQGESYVVEELDLHQQIAQVVKRDVDYYTVPLKTLSVRVLEELDHTSLNGIEVFLGELEITEDYMSYKIMRQDRILGYEPLSLPPVTFRTTGFWFLIPWSIEKQVEDLGWNFSGGLHGLEHAIIGIMPFHVMCDRWDLGGLSTPLHEDTNAATIFVYDGIEGGIGLSEKGFSLIQKILTMVEELLRDCKCDVGCPACVYSPKCGNENQPMDKGAALLIVKEVLQRMSRKNQRGVIRNE